MNYSKTLRDGSARDEALTRRKGGVRQALGMGLRSIPAESAPTVALDRGAGSDGRCAHVVGSGAECRKRKTCIRR
jgi:hypothetical protein